MNKKAILASLLLATLSAPAMAQVGVSVSVGQPGFYGQINIGDYPQPQVIYSQPVIASQALVPADAQPVYLYVPPGQVRKWKQNCARWSACDQPVLFVRVDDSPSRWGKWRHRREAQVALHGQD